MSSEPILPTLFPETSVLRDDGVTVGGVSLRELANRYGTPLFVYDEATLRARCREAAHVFDDGVAFASKSFLCGAMARLAVEEGLCVDVATGGELDIVLRAGVPASRVIVHGNNKSAEEIESAVAAGVHRLVVDNFEEIERLATVVSEQRPLNVLVRVTPGVEAHTHEYVRTGQEDTKFGFSVATGEARRAISMLRDVVGVRLHGVHAHIGSQIFELAGFRESMDVLSAFTREDDFDELCVGGGLGVAYVEGESAPSITEWATGMRAAARGSGLRDDLRLWPSPVEPSSPRRGSRSTPSASSSPSRNAPTWPSTEA
jgi:diaminopimelate decarboxylase